MFLPTLNNEKGNSTPDIKRRGNLELSEQWRNWLSHVVFTVTHWRLRQFFPELRKWTKCLYKRELRNLAVLSLSYWDYSGMVLFCFLCTSSVYISKTVLHVESGLKLCRFRSVVRTLTSSEVYRGLRHTNFVEDSKLRRFNSKVCRISSLFGRVDRSEV